jgi:hypothetical protein
MSNTLNINALLRHQASHYFPKFEPKTCNIKKQKVTCTKRLAVKQWYISLPTGVVRQGTLYLDPVSTCIHFHHEDEGSMDIRNVGILPQNYTASQSSRPRLAATDLRCL